MRHNNQLITLYGIVNRLSAETFPDDEQGDLYDVNPNNFSEVEGIIRSKILYPYQNLTDALRGEWLAAIKAGCALGEGGLVKLFEGIDFPFGEEIIDKSDFVGRILRLLSDGKI